MAELPEIYQLSTQMNQRLMGKQIEHLEIVQEKCCNVSVQEFESKVKMSKVKGVSNKGKWIVVSLSNGENILISLGMGGDCIDLSKFDQVPDINTHANGEIVSAPCFYFVYLTSNVDLIITPLNNCTFL